MLTNAQKIAIRLSEVRSRLNEVAGLDQLTDEVRNEADALGVEYKDLEVRHRSAIIAEGEEEERAAGAIHDGDGESAEVRSLLTRVNIGDYLNPASAGLGVAGGGAASSTRRSRCRWSAPAGACPSRGVSLAGPEHRELAKDKGQEQRAYTTTTAYGGGVVQRPILQRLFGMDIMGALGVRIDSVPAGRTEWPLITGGVAPVQKAEAAAANAAVTAVFATETLKPKRLTGKYEYTHEQAAQVPDIEQGLRRDLADAVKAKMNDLILNGDEGTNAQEPGRLPDHHRSTERSRGDRGLCGLRRRTRERR